MGDSSSEPDVQVETVSTIYILNWLSYKIQAIE